MVPSVLATPAVAAFRVEERARANGKTGSAPSVVNGTDKGARGIHVLLRRDEPARRGA